MYSYSLTDARNTRVAFHATFLSSESPPVNTPLIFNRVRYNHGNAYSRTTGRFTAPCDGIYFFVARSGSDVTPGYSYLYMMINGSTYDTTQTNYISGSHYFMPSLHMCMHLSQGDEVWVKSGGGTYWEPVSSFSGFLLSKD